MVKNTENIPRIYLVIASLIITFTIFIFAETGLRLVGFRFDTIPRFMQFNFPNKSELETFEHDPDTLWRLKPGVKPGPIIEPISSQGYRNPVFDVEKRPNVKRIVAMGDSVTFAGSVSYPRLLEKCLGGGWEVINAGVPGYTVYQGLRQFRVRIAALKPDFVIIMYGWNDHWLASGFVDSKQNVTEKSNKYGAVDFIKRFRIFQLLQFILSKAGGGSGAVTQRNYRVPIDEYRQLLGQLIDEVRAAGAAPILLTAPTALGNGKVPPFLLDNRFIEKVGGESDKDTANRLMKLHKEYTDAERGLARDKNIPLVDIETEWHKIDTMPLFIDITKDIVHPNDLGYALIAKQVCDKVKTLVP